MFQGYLARLSRIFPLVVSFSHFILVQGAALYDRKYLARVWQIFLLVSLDFCRTYSFHNKNILIRRWQIFPSVSYVPHRARPFLSQTFLMKSCRTFQSMSCALCRVRFSFNQISLIEPCRIFPSMSYVFCRARPFLIQFFLKRLWRIFLSTPCLLTIFVFFWARPVTSILAYLKSAGFLSRHFFNADAQLSRARPVVSEHL